MKKKLLAYALAMSMIVGAVPTIAWAEEENILTTNVLDEGTTETVPMTPLTAATDTMTNEDQTTGDETTPEEPVVDKEVQDVIDMIDALEGIEDEAAIENARNAYDGLNEDQKALVGEEKVAKLEALEAELKAAEEKEPDAVIDAETTDISGVIAKAKASDGKVLMIREGSYKAVMNFSDLTVIIDGEVNIEGSVSGSNFTVEGNTDRDTDVLNITGSGTLFDITGDSVDIKNVTLDCYGNETGNGSYLVWWKSKELNIEDSNFYARGNKTKYGCGLFLGDGCETFTSVDSELSFSNNGIAPDGKGIWADGDTTQADVVFNIIGGSMKLNDNGLNGFQGVSSLVRIFNFENVDVEACRNGIGTTSGSKGDGFSYGYLTFKNTDGGKYTLDVNDNHNNGISGGSGKTACDIDGYKVTANNNGSRGIYVGFTNPDKENTVFENSVITANENGYAGLYFLKNTKIEDCEIEANANGSYGVYFSQNAEIDDSEIEVLGNETTGIQNYHNLGVSDSVIISDKLVVSEEEVIETTNAHNGTYTAGEKTLFTGENVIALRGKTFDSKFEYTNYKGETTLGVLEIQGGSLQTSDEQLNYTTYMMDEDNDGEVKYPGKMSTNPINEDDVALYRFDLNAEKAGKDKGDRDSLTYFYNGCDEDGYQYDYRYNYKKEDLNGIGGMAYVWTPVTVLHYDATEGAVSELGSTAVVNEDMPDFIDANDITIRGESIKKSQREMPDVNRENYKFDGWYTSSKKTAEELQVLAAAKNYKELYDALNVEITAETKLDNVSDLTLYAKWEKESTGGGGGGGGSDIDVKVEKVWKLDDGGKAADSVTVTLLRDGKEYKTVELSDDNDWKYTWKNLSKGYKYTVEETDVPDGFKVSVDKKGSTFVITNDDIGKEPIKPDETPDALNGDDHFDYVVGYPDGKVHPEWNITRAEVAAIFFRLLKDEVRDGNLTFNNDFDDVPKGMWYTSSISTMAKLGIVYGRDDGGFDPNTNITRAEFAAIAARFDSQPYSGPDKFSDISGHWAARHINRAAEKGWIVGYPDGTFVPDRYITRAEAVTLINRVLNRLPESPAALHRDMKVWPDNMDKTAWFYLAMQEATNSHEYEKVNDIYERWPEMLPPRDWAQYLNER